MESLLRDNRIKYVSRFANRDLDILKDLQEPPPFVRAMSENSNGNGMEICNNCGKEIPKSKMTLHLAYCTRNIKKCEFCGDPFEIDALEEHIKNS